MFPDASRVLIRVICKELPTRHQDKKEKEKVKTFTFNPMGL